MNDFLEFLYAHIPHRWLNQKAKGTKKLFEGLAKDFVYLHGFVAMLKKNNQTRNAEELITELENEYGIAVNPSYDLDFRRERILAKIRMQDNPITEKALIEVLEIMGFFDIVIRPDIGKFHVFVSMTVPSKYNYKLYEIQGIVEENIRAHIGLYLEMTSETHFCTDCYIDGAVFGPVLETILPEIETVYDFKATAQIVSDYCSIESTRLPEMMVERRN